MADKKITAMTELAVEPAAGDLLHVINIGEADSAKNQNIQWSTIEALFVRVNGRAGGQTINGNTASGGDLTLVSTAHATKGKILFGTSAYDEANNRLGLNITSPDKLFHTSIDGNALNANILRTTADTLISNQADHAELQIHVSSATSTHVPTLALTKSRGTNASPTVLQSGDYIGAIEAPAYNGSSLLTRASIKFRLDGAISGSTVPSEILFTTGRTSADIQGRITSYGRFAVCGSASPLYDFSIISTDNSNQIGIYHDNSNANMTWNDGVLYLTTDEGTNTNTEVYITGKGTGRGIMLIWDEDGQEYLQLYCSTGGAVVQAGGTSPNELSLNPAAECDIECFNAAAEGETEEFRVYGYRTGDSKRRLEIACGSDAADTVSFDGVSNYAFDGEVLIGSFTALTNEGDVQCLGSGVVALKETSTPTADTDYGKVYCKNDNKLYFQDGAGAEHEIAFA